MSLRLKLKPVSRLTLAALILSIIILPFVALAAYKVEIGLPNLPAGSAVSDPGAYIRYLFIFGLSLAGFLAVAAIAWGGIQYMAAGTSLTSVQKAKDLIVGAISGIVLLLCSWLILATIDPSLTNLTPWVPKLGNIAAPPAPATAPQTYLTKQSDQNACVAKCAPAPAVYVAENNNCYCQGAPPATETTKVCWCDKNNCYKTKDACPLFMGVPNCFSRNVSESTICQ